MKATEQRICNCFLADNYSFTIDNSGRGFPSKQKKDQSTIVFVTNCLWGGEAPSIV